MGIEGKKMNYGFLKKANRHQEIYETYYAPNIEKNPMTQHHYYTVQLKCKNIKNKKKVTKKN
jgi:hypothetical protein